MSITYYAKCEDCEQWRHDEINDAVQELTEDIIGEISVGDTITIYSGECVSPKASVMVPSIFDLMAENAYDNYGEASESWDLSTEESLSLQTVVEAAVDKWFDDKGEQPKFGFMENIKPVEVIITGINEYDVEWEPKEAEPTKPYDPSHGPGNAPVPSGGREYA